VITDFEGNVFVHCAAMDATCATGIVPKAVLEQLLHHAERIPEEGVVRFVSTVDLDEIAMSIGVSVRKVEDALLKLMRWGWLRGRGEGFELGFQSAGGGDVFYGYESYLRLHRKLVGVESTTHRVAAAENWLNEIEEERNARRV